MLVCQVCGNSIDAGVLCCPFCKSEQTRETKDSLPKVQFYQKTVNLEQGLPTVNQALGRMQRELGIAQHEQIRIVTLIHGYGSSGKGGAIRLECRKYLHYLLTQKKIHTVIHGEDFHRHRGATKNLLGRFSQLRNHPHLGRGNKGITLVQLY